MSFLWQGKASMTNNDECWEDMGGKVSNTIVSKTTQKMHTQTFYTPTNCLYQYCTKNWCFKFWIVCFFSFSLTDERMRRKVQTTSTLKLNSKFTPNPRTKRILLGRVSAKVNRIVNFQTHWEIIRYAISWKGLVCDLYKVILGSFDVFLIFTSLDIYISSKRLVVERNGQA